MKIKLWQSISLLLLAIVFVIGLSFASLELPRIIDHALQDSIHHPAGDSHSDDMGALKTELFIQHYHLRWVGYFCFALIIVLILLGFLGKKSGFASAGAVALFLPVFAQFAGVMFFLAGLGILNLPWLPVLDISLDLSKLGDIVYLPDIGLRALFSLVGFNVHKLLTWFFIGGGLCLFISATFAWFYAKAEKKPIVDFWIYRFSRHPQYLGWILWSYGMLLMLLDVRYPKRSWGIAASLPWLLSSLVIIGVALLEEIKLRKAIGVSYEPYRRRAPFLFPLPAFIKKMISSPLQLFYKKQFPERKREVAFILIFYFVFSVMASLVWLTYTSEEWRVKLLSVANQERQITELVQTIKTSTNWRVQSGNALLLAAIGEPAVDALTGLLNDPDVKNRQDIIRALGKTKSQRAIAPLLACADDEHTTENLIDALGELRAKDAELWIRPFLHHDQARLRLLAAGALGKIGSTESIPLLLPGLADSEWYVRVAHAEALGRLRAEPAVAGLCVLVQENHEKYSVNVRRAAAIALFKIGSPRSVEVLRAAREDQDFEVRLYAAEALRRIGP